MAIGAWAKLTRDWLAERRRVEAGEAEKKLMEKIEKLREAIERLRESLER